MQVGLSTATFFGKVLTENALKKIKSMGVDIAEVFLTTFYEYEKSFIDRLVQELYEVQVYSVHSLNNHYEPELFNLVERTRKDAERLFDQVIDAARRMGAKYYTFHGPSRLKVRNYSLDYERVGNRVAELIERAKENGIGIAYENVSWAFYNNPGFFQKLIQYAPNLMACLDIKQAMHAYRHANDIGGRALTDREIAGLQDYTYEYIDDMGDALVNVHLSDYDAYGELCAPGKGIFDYKDLMDKLSRGGYKGPLMIELYSKDYESFAEVEDSVKYIRDIIRSDHDQDKIRL